MCRYTIATMHASNVCERYSDRAARWGCSQTSTLHPATQTDRQVILLHGLVKGQSAALAADPDKCMQANNKTSSYTHKHTNTFPLVAALSGCVILAYSKQQQHINQAPVRMYSWISYHVRIHAPASADTLQKINMFWHAVAQQNVLRKEESCESGAPVPRMRAWKAGA